MPPAQLAWWLHYHMRIGVSTFILGAGASVYHGLTLLMHPAELESLPTALTVLGVTGALEAYTLGIAWRETTKEVPRP